MRRHDLSFFYFDAGKMSGVLFINLPTLYNSYLVQNIEVKQLPSCAPRFLQPHPLDFPKARDFEAYKTQFKPWISRDRHSSFQVHIIMQTRF